MQINIKEFLSKADINEPVYPGKRIVKKCKQVGEYKNHCVIIDWRDPDNLNIDIRPGLSGKRLAPDIISKYPVCFQIPTSVKIKVTNDNKDDDSDDEKGESSGKSDSGGGGKKIAKKKLEDIELIASRFDSSAEGTIPKAGEIKEMIVMGMQIAKESFGNAFAELTRQINHAHIVTTEILAKAMDLVTRIQPPSFLTPKGDEAVSYNYDRGKNADIGFKMSL